MMKLSFLIILTFSSSSSLPSSSPKSSSSPINSNSVDDTNTTKSYEEIHTWLNQSLNKSNEKGKNVLQVLQSILDNLGFDIRPKKGKEKKNDEKEDDKEIEWKQCPEEKCPSRGCGVPNRLGRVVNGSAASLHEFPWMASVHLRLPDVGQVMQCGGVLINDKYVITAAHCLHRQQAKHLLVQLGQHFHNDSEQSLRVRRIVRHPLYKADTFDHDVALLKLADRADLGLHVRPVCLDTKPISYEGQTGLIAGWGRTTAPSSLSSPRTSSVLQKASVLIFGRDECTRDFKYAKGEIKSSMMCAGHRDARQDACLGDSGGPLMVLDEALHRFALAGLISWGHGCAVKGYPGVYARVASFLKWIRDHTRDSCFCH